MRRGNRRRTGAVILALSTAWAVAAQAQNASMVVRDADSGQLRAAMPQEAQALSSSGPAAGSLSAGRRGVVTGSLTPQQWVLSNGAVVAETTEDMMSSMVAVRSPDGKLVILCSPNETAAEHLAHRDSKLGHNVSEAGHALK